MSYIVIKCGGSIADRLPDSFFKSLIQLSAHGFKPIIVHGGGPGISFLLNKLEIESRFVNGLRVTTEEVVDVAEMVLSGSMNKWFVKKITELGGRSIGISGVDGMLLTAERLSPDDGLGFVGRVTKVNCELIISFLDNGYLPVISPIGINGSGQKWNINADHAAGAIAMALKAPLCFVTDVSGVLQEGRTMRKLSDDECRQMIQNAVITGGMIPKVEAVLECLAAGIEKVMIVNGLEEDSLLKIAKGENTGTFFYQKEALLNG